MAYKLKLTERLDLGARRVGVSQIDAATALLQGDGDPAETIHATRKYIKKVRALLRLCRPGLADGVFAEENARFRDIGRQLSKSRDQHVLLTTLEAMRDRSSGQARLACTAAMAAFAPPRAHRGSKAVAYGPLFADVSEELRFGRAAIAKLPVDGGYDTAFSGIAGSYRKARRAMHHASTTLDAEDLHEFRKHVQHHWRHMQLVSAGWPEFFDARAATARRLSNVLGDDHDLVALAERLQVPEAPLTARRRALLLAAIEVRQQELRSLARQLGNQLFAEPPAAFRETVAYHWTTACDADREAHAVAAE